MTRLARVVVPGVPHHVIQRGNRRQETFFDDDDYLAYRALLAKACEKAGTAVWAYCLMPNHVHLILVPSTPDGLRAAVADAHRRYARRINLREDWRGHLWQERFHSFAMDEAHLAACARYVELNPLRARLVRRPEDWPWSSARAHLRGADDGLVQVAPLVRRYGDWRAFLKTSIEEETLANLRRHVDSGRPLGSTRFLRALERKTGRALALRPRGRPRKGEGAAEK